MGSAWDASSTALWEGRYRLDSRRGVNHLRQICQDRGCSAILVRSQSRVAQRQSIRLLIGRLLVRIQARERKEPGHHRWPGSTRVFPVAVSRSIGMQAAEVCGIFRRGALIGAA